MKYSYQGPLLARRGVGVLAACFLLACSNDESAPSADAVDGGLETSLLEDATSQADGGSHTVQGDASGRDASTGNEGAPPDAGEDHRSTGTDATDDHDTTAADAADGHALLDAGAVDSSVGSCSGATAMLTRDVVPILTGACSGEMCHGNTIYGAFGGAPGTHRALVNVPATRDTCSPGVLVSPGSLSKSYLMNKLTGVGMCAGTKRMPPGGALSASDIQIIANWICGGALNN